MKNAKKIGSGTKRRRARWDVAPPPPPLDAPPQDQTNPLGAAEQPVAPAAAVVTERRACRDDAGSDDEFNGLIEAQADVFPAIAAPCGGELVGKFGVFHVWTAPDQLRVRSASPAASNVAMPPHRRLPAAAPAHKRPRRMIEVPGRQARWLSSTGYVAWTRMAQAAVAYAGPSRPAMECDSDSDAGAVSSDDESGADAATAAAATGGDSASEWDASSASGSEDEDEGEDAGGRDDERRTQTPPSPAPHQAAVNGAPLLGKTAEADAMYGMPPVPRSKFKGVSWIRANRKWRAEVWNKGSTKCVACAALRPAPCALVGLSARRAHPSLFSPQVPRVLRARGRRGEGRGRRVRGARP